MRSRGFLTLTFLKFVQNGSAAMAVTYNRWFLLGFWTSVEATML